MPDNKEMDKTNQFVCRVMKSVLTINCEFSLCGLTKFKPIEETSYIPIKADLDTEMHTYYSKLI